MHGEELGQGEYYTDIPRKDTQGSKDNVQEYRGDQEDGNFGVSLPRTSTKTCNKVQGVPTSFSGVVFLTPNSDMPPSSIARFHAPKLLSSTAISLGVRPSASLA